MIKKIDAFYIRDRALEVAIKSEAHYIYNDENNTLKCDVDKLIESAKKIENYLNGECKNANV